MNDDSIRKVPLIKSIRLRCVLLVLSCVLISAGVCFGMTVSRFSQQVSKETKANMIQTCTAYEKLIEQKVATTGGMVETSQFKAILSDVKIDSLNSSYFYLVSGNGTMLYHPESKRVGKPVENSAIKEVVAKIQKGTIPGPEVVTYKYKGRKKYAGFVVSQSSHMILAITADESDVYSQVNKLIRSSIIWELFLCMILSLAGGLVSRTITIPIRKLGNILNKASKLDFSEDEDVKELLNKRDEFGLIMVEYKKLQDNLKHVIGRIGDTSEQILVSAEEIDDVVRSVNEHSQDNSATSQQLAAGMEETAATVDTIDSNVDAIQKNTSEINEKTISGARLAAEIKNRADELEKTTTDAIREANIMFETVKTKSKKAIEESKAVEKINMLSNTIMDIADETSLLSINATIEAARAGEMGRGFAVVASQISTLASQSAETVNGISEIVTEVQKAVQNMSECLETSLHFFENSVQKDYNYFKETSSQYNVDAAELQVSMDNIHKEISELSKVTQEISTAVSGIAATVNEATVGVTDIAGKTSDVVSLVSETGVKIEANKKYSKDLKNIVEEFKL